MSALVEVMAGGLMEGATSEIEKLRADQAALVNALKLAAVELTFISEGRIKPHEIEKTLGVVFAALGRVSE
jgi:hypothetical protein